MARLRDRIVHAWNAFTNSDDERDTRYFGFGEGASIRPDRNRLRVTNERSIIASIYNRLAIDGSAIDMRHVKLDENNRYLETVDSGLNRCLNLRANIDQIARHFKQDIINSMLDKGVIAVVAVDTTLDPKVTGSYDVKTMRVGEIVHWYPDRVRINLYNEKLGRKKEITLPKAQVAILENPFYSVMNEPNSTYQRLTRKLDILDAVDNASSSGKLDIIIQLPYTVRSEARQRQAEQRAKDIEVQLRNSRYGIAYTDGTEKITQLNRPTENKLLSQIEYLTEMLYGQLGITKGVLDNTATEQEMVNYYSRTIEPILATIATTFKTIFLTNTAITQGHSVEFYRDPFKLVPVSAMAEIADKFTRNEILTSNEIRAYMGIRPSSDPKADKLQNSNMPQPPELPPESV